MLQDEINDYVDPDCNRLSIFHTGAESPCADRFSRGLIEAFAQALNHSYISHRAIGLYDNLQRDGSLQAILAGLFRVRRVWAIEFLRFGDSIAPGIDSGAVRERVVT
jgi:hypothetical protein